MANMREIIAQELEEQRVDWERIDPDPEPQLTAEVQTRVQAQHEELKAARAQARKTAGEKRVAKTVEDPVLISDDPDSEFDSSSD